MAKDNDAELKVGVRLDTTGLKEDLQSALSSIYDEVGGDKFFAGNGTKDWTKYPFAQSHLAGGNAWNTNALNAGMSNDLRAMGYTPESSFYQSAMAATGVQFLSNNPMDRFGILNAHGMEAAASMAHPDSDFSKIIETNKRLMELPFARDFITDNAVEEQLYTEKGNPRRHRVNGELKPLTKTVTSYEADFQGMRERAVEMGLGRWTDNEKHDASTFEFIEEEVENIEKKSEKTKRHFLDWGDLLKGVLGTLTAIAGATGGAVLKFNKDSEKGVLDASTYLDNDRWFYSMDYMDLLKSKVGAKQLGIGEDTLYKGIKDLSNKRTKFKTFGEGLDATTASLLGELDSIASSTDNPMEAYIKIAENLVTNSTGIGKEQMGMLLNNLGISGLTDIVGAVNNGRFGSVREIFQMKDNPYYGSYIDAEQLRKDLVPLNESIKASYQQMYNDWQDAFGIPFKGWWDSTLENVVVPWFHKFTDAVGKDGRKSMAEDKDMLEFQKEWDRTVNASARKNNLKTLNSMDSVYAASMRSLKDEYGDNTVYGIPKEEVININALKALSNPKSKAKDMWKALVAAADPSNYYDADNSTFYSRALVTKGWLERTGMSDTLSNNKNDAIDDDIVELVALAMNTSGVGSTSAILDKFITDVYTQTPGYSELVTKLTEIADILKDNPEKREYAINNVFFGTNAAGVANAMDAVINQ